MSKNSSFVIRTHYEASDTRCISDYVDIEVFFGDPCRLIKTFGDAYHDKGRDKAEAFVDGWASAIGVDPKIEFENVADRDI